MKHYEFGMSQTFKFSKWTIDATAMTNRILARTSCIHRKQHPSTNVSVTSYKELTFNAIKLTLSQYFLGLKT